MAPKKQGQDSFLNADMAELADAPDLGSGGTPRAGSSPVIRTCIYK